MLKKILAWRGIHFIATRYCGTTVRQWAFDAKYQSGDWIFKEGKKSGLADSLHKYAAGGGVLILGCGTASIVGALDLEKLGCVCGVDLSPAAIEIAAKNHPGKNVKFEVADILEYQPARNYDVILFSESFNYIKPPDREPLLKRLFKSVNPRGCIIITLSNPERYRDIIGLVQGSFKVLQEGSFEDSKRYLLIFTLGGSA